MELCLSSTNLSIWRFSAPYVNIILDLWASKSQGKINLSHPKSPLQYNDYVTIKNFPLNNLELTTAFSRELIQSGQWYSSKINTCCHKYKSAEEGFLLHVIFVCKVIIWNVICVWAPSFIFNWQRDDLKSESFWGKKCLTPGGTWTRNLRVHAEYSTIWGARTRQMYRSVSMSPYQFDQGATARDHKWPSWNRQLRDRSLILHFWWASRDRTRNHRLRSYGSIKGCFHSNHRG